MVLLSLKSITMTFVLTEAQPNSQFFLKKKQMRETIFNINLGTDLASVKIVLDIQHTFSNKKHCWLPP